MLWGCIHASFPVSQIRDLRVLFLSVSPEPRLILHFKGGTTTGALEEDSKSDGERVEPCHKRIGKDLNRGS